MTTHSRYLLIPGISFNFIIKSCNVTPSVALVSSYNPLIDQAIYLRYLYWNKHKQQERKEDTSCPVGNFIPTLTVVDVLELLFSYWFTVSSAMQLRLEFVTRRQAAMVDSCCCSRS